MHFPHDTLPCPTKPLDGESSFPPSFSCLDEVVDSIYNGGDVATRSWQ
jgi:hypothetical protein